MIREIYERHLKEAANKAIIVEKDLCAYKAEADERRKYATEISQRNKYLNQQFEEAQEIISEKEHCILLITNEKANLEAYLKKAADTQKKLIERNEFLNARLMEMKNESVLQSLKSQGLNLQLEREVHFKDIFTDLEHRIINLQMKQEEITADKNVQLGRIDTIVEQLSKLDEEARRLHCEREDVEAILDTQEKELARTVGNLMFLKEQLGKNYLMASDVHDDSNVETLEETVSELGAFVESSKMRISDIDERIKEVKEEKSVLMQQQSHALGRKNEYVNC
jgi:chromosome segregation ATPase